MIITPCIESKKGITNNGYSRIRKGKMVQAHRWAWELINGKIPEGLTIDHMCRTRACVALDHLRVVTLKENVRASTWCIDNRTHCKQGHSFEGNIMVRKDGKRECAECNRVRARNNYAKAGA